MKLLPFFSRYILPHSYNFSSSLHSFPTDLTSRYDTRIKKTNKKQTQILQYYRLFFRGKEELLGLWGVIFLSLLFEIEKYKAKKYKNTESKNLLTKEEFIQILPEFSTEARFSFSSIFLVVPASSTTESSSISCGKGCPKLHDFTIFCEKKNCKKKCLKILNNFVSPILRNQIKKTKRPDSITTCYCYASLKKVILL